MVEADVREIRDNQMKKKRGEPVGEKKNPPREHGEMFRGDIEERYQSRAAYKYQSNSWEPDKNTKDQNINNTNNETQNNSAPLASKLSQAYNTQINSVTKGPEIPQTQFQNQNQNNLNVSPNP